MKPLLKNDLRWAGPLGFAGLIIYLLSFLSHTPGAIWVIPSVNGGAVALAFGCIAATVLGLVAALVEDVTRTREYLLHRPVSVERVFWTRHGLGLVIVAAWMVLGPALHLAASHLFSPNAALLDDSRLWMLIGQGLPALMFYALGVWVATLPRTGVGGTLLLAVVGITLWLAVMAGVLVPPAAVSAIVVVAALALALLLLWAALAAFRGGRDPDRPWTAARLRRAGPIAAVVSILAGSMGATLIEIGATGGLLGLYPVAREHDGQVMLVRYSSWDRKHYQTDEQHRLGAEVKDPFTGGLFDPTDDAWSLDDGDVPLDGFPNRGRYFRGVAYTRAFVSTYTPRQVFLGSDGFVHLYRLATDDGQGEDRPYTARLGKGPHNQPFSPKTRRFSGAWDRVAALFDPADGGLWLYDFHGGAPGFHRAELPGGDHFVATNWFLRLPAPALERTAMLAPLYVWGERGRYVLTEQGQFVPAQPDANAIPAPRRKPHVRFHSPTSFAATVTTEDGRTVFTHEYRPYTLGEKATAALVVAPVLARPPLTALPSLLTPERNAHDLDRLLLAPAVARGGHWLVPANLLVAIALAFLTHRRLRRLGITGGRRRFWVAVVLGGGLPGWLCQRLVETRRAWRPLPVPEQAPAPVLMIRDLPAVRPV